MDTNNNSMEVYYVEKRNKELEEVNFNKILNRVKNLSTNLTINPTILTQKLINQIYPNIPTSKIDELAGELCASMTTEHPIT